MSFVPDNRTAMLDLVFLLFGFFFVTTVISVRAPSVADDVASEDPGKNEAAIVVQIESFEATGPRLVLVSNADRAAPVAGASVQTWLATTCGTKTARVEVGCPDDATHVACKKGLSRIRRQAPACRYRY